MTSSLSNKRGNDSERQSHKLTAPDTMMPEQRSRRVFTWVSMPDGNSCKMCAAILRDERETSDNVWFYLKLTRALILTGALVEYGLTELTSGQQLQT